MFDEQSNSSTAQSSISSGPITNASHRKERGAIAAQACDTCRSRKQRCDEERPKCGTCQKFKLTCNYREPQPTKKDRTLMEILDRIKGLEDKIDGLTLQPSFRSTSYAPMSNANPSTGPQSMSPGINDAMTTSSFHVSSLPSADQPSAPSGNDDHHYIYVSAVHQMMGWPAMQRLLEPVKDKIPGLDPATIEQDGPSIILGTHEYHRRLPLSTDGSAGQIKTMGRLSMNAPGDIPLTIPALTWDTMQALSKAYFDTLNFLFPLVDRQVFLNKIMPSVLRSGFSESIESTIALLVFAMGELVIAGTQGIPIRVYNGRPSGLRGGTDSDPPGLALFNEARRRMGLNLTECSIENVQTFALAGLYYGACGHDMEEWRMTTSASLAVQALISSKPSELSGPNKDLVRRAFWHCAMMETCITLELCLPTTGLERWEQVVGLPDFSGSFAQEDYDGNQSTHFQEHFATQIVLRRMMMEFHHTLGHDSSTISPPAASSPSFSSASSSSAQAAVTDLATIKQLAPQLDQWRGMLPVPLRWPEDSPGAFPAATPGQETHHHAPGFNSQPMSPRSAQAEPSRSGSTHHRSVSGQQHQPPTPPPLMFTTDLDAPPNPYPFAYDIQVALLRTRYYYAKYLLHRPFLYKALHYPDSVTADDAAGVATCLRAALKWPVTMSPACTRKRLIPCNFFWTQNVLGVLLILHLTSTDPMLQRIVRGGLCGETWEVDVAETVGPYLDWLRDLSEADPAAKFAWEIVKAVYRLE